MNKSIINTEVQAYIYANQHADVHTMAMARSPFKEVTSRELAIQITSRKKAQKKLPTWYQHESIYYPEPLSVEQSSSEKTAAYKATLINGGSLIDLTGGFGVDCYYFAKQATEVLHCEINTELSAIAAHNAQVLGAQNIGFEAVDGLAYLRTAKQSFDNIYIDPARRSDAGKVFMLKDCSPNVVENLDLLLEKGRKIIIKTSPLLDITAGIRELRQVSEVHVISTQNECKELLFILKPEHKGPIRIISTTINEQVKQFTSLQEQQVDSILASELGSYLYEPDVSLLKSGAFSLIGQEFGLEKLQEQSQLYTSNQLNTNFPGRIFKVEGILKAADLKKAKDLYGNVIVRNYPDKAEQLVKKYKIQADQDQFLIFTQMKRQGLVIIKARITQYY